MLGGKKADLSDPRDVWEEFFKAAMKNEWDKSLGFLETLRKLDPSNPQVFMKTGDILQRLGRGGESVATYQKAASLLEESEEWTKALATYKVIIRLAPGDEKALARSKDIMGRIRAARDTAVSQAPEPVYEEPAPSGGGESAPVSKPAPAVKSPGKPRDLREAFARHPIFSVLSDDEIKFMSTKARHLSFNDADVVIEEDTQGDSIYVIKKGKAEVTTSVAGQTLELASLGGLAFFGEGGFLTGAPRTATVTASGKLDVMEIPKTLMSELIIKNPQVLGRLVELLRVRASKSSKARGDV